MTRDSFLQFLFGGKTSTQKSAPTASKRKTLNMETLEDRHMLSVSFDSPSVESHTVNTYVPDTGGVAVNPNLVSHRLLFSGDFNNDGKTDLLAIQGGNAYTYLNSGSTTNAFPNAGESAANGLYTTMQAGVGKVTGGSYLDLLTANMLNNVLTISAIPGSANGTFYTANTITSTWSGVKSFLETQGVTFPAGASLYTQLGDICLVENSGRVDLICTISYQVIKADNTVHTSGDLVLQFTNNGQGKFTVAPTVLKAGSTTISAPVIAAGDLTGDSKPDYVTINKDNAKKLDIYLNGGTKLTTKDFGKEVGEVVVAKCHSGNKMEVITALSDASGKNYLCVITVTGTTITYSEEYPVDIVPVNIVTGDLNNDGIYDIFISDGNMHQTLLGKSDGKFAKQNAVIANADFMTAYTADFNGDGKMDTLAVGKRFAWLIPGDSAKPVTVVADFAALGMTPLDVAFGDFNGDGKMDFVVLNHLGSSVYVFTNQTTSPATPVFTRTSTLTASMGKQLLVANFDNANGDDIIVYGYDDSGTAKPSLQTWLSTSSGGFSTVKTTSLPTMTGTTKPYDLLAVGEVTNDGYIDIVGIWNGNIGTSAKQSYYHVLENTASNPGVFITTRSSVSLGSKTTTYPTAVAIGDMTGNGKNDLVLLDADSKSVWIMPQTTATGGGVFYTSGNNFEAFTVTTNNVEIAAFSNLALGDFHAAGILDVMVGVVTTSGNMQFRVMENNPANKGKLLTNTNFTTVGSFDGATASSLAFHVGLLDDNGTADVVVVGGNTVKRFINTDKSGGELGTVTLVIRDYSSTLISTETVDLGSLANRLTYIDEWSNFWVEIWANTGTSAGISSFTTSLTFNADVFEVRSGKIEYGTSFTQKSAPVIGAGVITLSATSSSGSRGANTNTLLARVSFMPVDGAKSGQTETKGLLLNFQSNSLYVQPIANGFALDAAKSTITTSASITAGPQSVIRDTIPLIPVVYDLMDRGVVDVTNFGWFIRAALFPGNVSASGAPVYSRLCDYNYDGVVNVAGDMSFFTSNLISGISRDKCRTDPTLKVRYSPDFIRNILAAPLSAPAAQAVFASGLFDDSVMFDEIFNVPSVSEPLIPTTASTDQSMENQALMAYVASQETRKDGYDLEDLNPASETERLLAEGKL